MVFVNWAVQERLSEQRHSVQADGKGRAATLYIPLPQIWRIATKPTTTSEELSSWVRSDASVVSYACMGGAGHRKQGLRIWWPICVPFGDSSFPVS